MEDYIVEISKYYFKGVLDNSVIQKALSKKEEKFPIQEKVLKELDDLINKLATTFDVKERQKITKEASQLIIDEAYGTYIVSQANVNVSNNKVGNMHNFPIDYYFLTADTKITK